MPVDANVGSGGWAHGRGRGGDDGPGGEPFDGGRTWHPGEQVGQDTRWLLRGSAIPDDPARPAVEVALTVRPLVRGVDDPEVVVRDAPHVIVT